MQTAERFEGGKPPSPVQRMTALALAMGQCIRSLAQLTCCQFGRAESMLQGFKVTSLHLTTTHRESTKGEEGLKAGGSGRQLQFSGAIEERDGAEEKDGQRTFNDAGRLGNSG